MGGGSGPSRGAGVRRRHRIALALAALVGGIVLVVGLATMGGASEGPISAALGELGSWVRSVESRIARGIRGSGRADGLEWLAPYREDPERLGSPDVVLLGAYGGGDPVEEAVALEETLGVTFPLVHTYAAWGDAADQDFPAAFVETVHALGSVPVITWEPWLTTFENRLHPHLPLRNERDRNGLGAVAHGEYDFYVDAWAREAARHDGPVILRFAHEMNDPYRYPWGPHNNEAADFIAAWRHVVERFRAAGADRVLWAWSPHVAYEGYWSFWPGEAYVDWVATGALNYGTAAVWSKWYTFDQIFGRHYEELHRVGKPIMIAEFGSLSTGGDRVEWYRDALTDLPLRYPAVRSILFFEVADDATVTPKTLDWTVAGDPAVIRAVTGAISAWPSEGPAF